MNTKLFRWLTGGACPRRYSSRRYSRSGCRIPLPLPCAQPTDYPGRRADPGTWAESFRGHATPVFGPASRHRTQSDEATKLAFPQAAISFPEREEEAPCLDRAERA